MPTGAPDITAIVAFFKRLNGSILLHFQGRGVPLLTRQDDRYECDFFLTIVIFSSLISASAGGDGRGAAGQLPRARSSTVGRGWACQPRRGQPTRAGSSGRSSRLVVSIS